MSGNGIDFYQSSQGARIYRIPIALFPSLNGFAHLVIADQIKALVDVGSGVGDSNDRFVKVGLCRSGSAPEGAGCHLGASLGGPMRAIGMGRHDVFSSLSAAHRK